MRTLLFISYTPFHTLVAEAALETYLSHETDASAVIFRMDAATAFTPRSAHWDAVHSFGRPDFRVRRPLLRQLQRARDARQAWRVITERYARGAGVLHFAHLSEYLSNSAVSYLRSRGGWTFAGLQDGLLNYYIRRTSPSTEFCKALIARGMGMPYTVRRGLLTGFDEPWVSAQFCVDTRGIVGTAAAVKVALPPSEQAYDGAERGVAIVVGQEPLVAVLGRDTYVRLIGACVERARAHAPDGRVFYKPHHHASQMEVDDLVARYGVSLLTAPQPLELLGVDLVPSVVVGISSTALLTMALGRVGSTKIISVGLDLAVQEPEASSRIESLMRKFGVSMVPGREALRVAEP